MKKIHYLILTFSLSIFFQSCSVPTTSHAHLAFFDNAHLIENSTWAIYSPGVGWRGFYFQKGQNVYSLSVSYSTKHWPTKLDAIDDAKQLSAVIQVHTTNSFDDYDSFYYDDPVSRKNLVFRFTKDRKSGSFIIKEAGLAPSHFSMLRVDNP